MKALQRTIFIVVILLITGAAASRDARADVLLLKLDDEITPASAEVIKSAITRAEREQAQALIIELDTPGGLGTSMDDIVSAILASRVPVVVYVAPSGRRAASAGFVILLSAHVAAMAPATRTGSAHPVMGDGREMDKTMNEKVLNDAAAGVRTLAEKRGRDPKAAEAGVRESKDFTEREAIESRLIEIIARDEWDLLAQLNGRTVTLSDESKVTLETSNAKLTEVTPSLRQRLLMALADPRIAFVLFAIGALCIYFEFQHPGAVVPGVVGALAVVLALYGFHMLPINLTGVLLIGVAIALFVLEAKVQGFGILGLGGIVAAVIGSLILIDVPNPELRLPLTLVLAVVVPFAVILTVMLRLALRARGAKVTTGMAGMIGLIGRAETPVSPEGTVFVRGELWSARSQMQIARGETVRVTGMDRLTLEVEAIRDDAVVPKEASAVDGQSVPDS
ncbi:MAG TPA: nodulation protein NfeD [Blastocatellia bacterium]|nr:nodulation protein NfeD [Blastocatellia bacterium]